MVVFFEKVEMMKQMRKGDVDQINYEGWTYSVSVSSRESCHGVHSRIKTVSCCWVVHKRSGQGLSLLNTTCVCVCVV